MPLIGSLGKIIFEVSSEAVRTFRDLQMSRSARYATHDIHGRKSLLEFTGLGVSSLSLKITLNAHLGIDPKEELEALRQILKDHEAVSFVLDGEPQGDDLWVIDSLSEAHSTIDNKGCTVIVDVNVSLKEYLRGGA